MVAEVASPEPSLTTVRFDCSGDGGREPSWQATLDLLATDLMLPDAIAVGGAVDLAVILESEEWEGSAFAVRVQGQVVLAGLSGPWLDIDFVSGEPQTLWSPMIVSAEAMGLCPGEEVQCNTSLERGTLVFAGVLPTDVTIFDHDVHLEGDHELRVGAALTGTGEPQCDGATSNRYDFLVVNRE